MGKPWTDEVVMHAIAIVSGLEQDARAMLDSEDVAERDEAINTVRHVVVVRRHLEGWLGRRALRRRLEQQAIAAGGR